MTTDRCQLKVRVRTDLRTEARRLARRRRESMSQLIENLLEREIDGQESGALPDEAVIRDMAILIAVEHALKLLEADIAGGITLSKRVAETAPHAAIARIELVEQRLRRMDL